MSLSIDVIKIIFEYCDLQDQISLTKLSKTLYDELKIIKIVDKRLTQKILLQKKFSRLEELDANNNTKIVDVNHLKDSLKVLKCARYSGINQDGIKELNKLEELIVDDNDKIINLN